jgi:hypothetical protein
MQLCPAEHVTPQPPQLPLMLRLVSQPFAEFPSQFPQPALHEPMSHEPEPHVAVALAREHPTPQPPQFASELSGDSQPLLALPSQLPKPPLHANWQLEPEHEMLALARAGHALPQPPQ